MITPVCKHEISVIILVCFVLNFFNSFFRYMQGISLTSLQYKEKIYKSIAKL